MCCRKTSQRRNCTDKLEFFALLYSFARPGSAGCVRRKQIVTRFQESSATWPSHHSAFRPSVVLPAQILKSQRRTTHFHSLEGSLQQRTASTVDFQSIAACRLRNQHWKKFLAGRTLQRNNRNGIVNTDVLHETSANRQSLEIVSKASQSRNNETRSGRSSLHIKSRVS